MRLNAREFFEDGARGIPQAGALLPHLEALPQHEGKETDEDMGLHAIFALMPDRAHVELVFLDAEGGFGLGELDIGFPELLIAPIGDVGAQGITAFGKGRPIVEGGVASKRQTELRRTLHWLQGDGEAGCSALVLLQDTSDLPVHLCRIEAFF